MTQNQIRFLELQEAQRANLAKEAENTRTNTTKEKETERSNKEAERLNREKWEYEKYGKDPVGQAVRTIKSGLDELTKGNAADNPKSVGYTPTTDPQTGKTYQPVTIGGMNQGTATERNKQRDEWMKMKKSDFFKLYDQVMNGEKQMAPYLRVVLENVAQTRKYSG